MRPTFKLYISQNGSNGNLDASVNFNLAMNSNGRLQKEGSERNVVFVKNCFKCKAFTIRVIFIKMTERLYICRSLMVQAMVGLVEFSIVEGLYGTCDISG
jgi:hypothetical protein